MVAPSVDAWIAATPEPASLARTRFSGLESARPAPSALSTRQVTRLVEPGPSTSDRALERSVYGATPDGIGRSLVAWSMLSVGAPHGSSAVASMKARSV